MCYQPKRQRLIAELDQQLAKAEHRGGKEAVTDPQPASRSEIVDVVRAALADIEWQLAQSRIEQIRKTCLHSNQQLRAGAHGGRDVRYEYGMINEFIAASDAESTLESALRAFDAEQIDRRARVF